MERRIFYTAETKEEYEELESAMKNLLRHYTIQTETHVDVRKGFEGRVRVTPLAGMINEIQEIPREGKPSNSRLERLTPQHKFAVISIGSTTYQINFDSTVGC